ncbi:MAG: GNAT family N-acetyltransferase [Fluviicola sp.]|nr:GNAT family N-acetyltransferase [Fluviicola sp.]
MFTFKPEPSYYQIETERLSFVPLTEGHKLEWADFFIDNSTEHFLGFENSTKTAEEKAAFWVSKQIDRKNKHEFGQLAVIEKKSGDFIGLAGIIPRELKGVAEYEITYSFFAKVWGKGYATEAATTFKNYLFKNTTVKSVISIIHIENEASMKVAKKNEMVISDETSYMEMPVFIFRTQ